MDTGNFPSQVELQSLSHDGRYVVYVSDAINLVSGIDCSDGTNNIYRFDRYTSQTELVSVDMSGTKCGDDDSSAPSISADGTVVTFQSEARNLHPLSSFRQNIFARNLPAGVTQLASVNASATGGGDDDSEYPEVADNGRYVVFRSSASDLHPLDSNNHTDIFRYDLLTGETQLVSLNAEGTASGNAASFWSSMSADGNVIAFSSFASDIDPLDNDSGTDVFLRNMSSEVTSLISVNDSGMASGAGASTAPSLSADGSRLAFQSDAPDLHELDTDDRGDIFVKDIVSGELELVSISADGTSSGDRDSRNPAISADGTVVAFSSEASTLHPLDDDTDRDFFARVLSSGETKLVTVNAAGTEGGNGNPSPGTPLISADGRLVAFKTSSSDLHPIDVNDKIDVFVRDLTIESTTMVTVNGATGTDPFSIAFSRDGTTVAFGSGVPNLSQDDFNQERDLFVVDALTGDAQVVSRVPLGLESTTALGDSYLAQSAISADGRYVAFVSDASNLIPGLAVVGGFDNVYRWDRVTGQVELASINMAGTGGGDSRSIEPAISSDGQQIAFTSAARDLHPLDMDGTDDVFVRNFLTGTTDLISISSDGMSSGDASALAPSISGDGNRVAFYSKAGNLHPLADRAESDIFLHDLSSGTTDLISMDPLGTSGGNNDSFTPLISTNGSVVAFTSRATNLESIDDDTSFDVFARDLSTGVTQLVSVSFDGNTSGDGVFESLAISGNGAVIAFVSNSTNLHPLATQAPGDVFARDLVQGQTHLVSINATGSGEGNGKSDAPRINYDGSRIVYASRASNLHPHDFNTTVDVFLRDLNTSTTELISISQDGSMTANNQSYSPSISADGNLVAFMSFASDATAMDSDEIPDVLVRNLVTERTKLVSVSPFPSGPRGWSLNPAISADGTALAFESQSVEFIANDLNRRQDVFYASVPGASCDLDHDRICDLNDIDELISQIARGTSDLAFDLDGDGAVNLGDRDQWLEDAGGVNLGSGAAYLVGDANLDGLVDGRDFVIWNTHKFSETSRWSNADFDANGLVDGRDFVIWNINKFVAARAAVQNQRITPPLTTSIHEQTSHDKRSSRTEIGQEALPAAALEVWDRRAFMLVNLYTSPKLKP